MSKHPVSVIDPSAKYDVRTFQRITGVPAPTLRTWVQRGLVVPPTFRGRSTRYGHGHVVRVLAIRRLRSELTSLDAVAARLAELSQADIERIAGFESEPIAPLAPHPPMRPTLRAESAPIPSPKAASVGPPAAHDASERWRRRVLVPGLEVHVREDAGEVLRRLADEIVARYAANPGS